MKAIKKLWNNSCFDRYLFGILIAIELLMSFTSLGYIHIPPISLTTAYIPLLVAACLLGPVPSAIIGFIFGLASMYKASASYIMEADKVFSPFFSGFPVNSLLLSIGTRTLFGILIGFAFVFAKKTKFSQVWIAAISAIAPKLHSLLVYSAMGLLFPKLGYDYHSTFHWNLDDILLPIVCVVIVELLWAFYQSDTIQNIRFCIDQSIDNPYNYEKTNFLFTSFELFVLGMAIFAAVYFSRREVFMLQQHGIAVSPAITADLLLLQIQFLIASLALNFISVFLLISIYRYMSYREYAKEIDELTGVFGRRIFFNQCNKAQERKITDPERTGWFLCIDVDYFKTINDTFGHPVGDKVLQGIAKNLHTIFSEGGKVGRIGGDEFAVLIENPMTQQELGQKLEQFLQTISGILPEKKVTCSIGAYQFVFPQNIKHLLSEADRVLYKAKEKGRACYMIKGL